MAGLYNCILNVYNAARHRTRCSLSLSPQFPKADDRVVEVLSDGAWHSVRDVARVGKMSPRSASMHLQSLLTRGKVLWKGIGAREHRYRLIDDSLRIKVKERKPHLEDRIVDRLRQSIGDRFYFDGVFAKRVLDLLDWYASINLYEIHVSRKLVEKASEALNALNDEVIVAPQSLNWKLANRAMQIAALVKIIPQYNPHEMKKHGNMNVIKVERLLANLKEQSERDYKRVLEMAVERGLISSERTEFARNSLEELS